MPPPCLFWSWTDWYPGIAILHFQYCCQATIQGYHSRRICSCSCMQGIKHGEKMSAISVEDSQGTCETGKATSWTKTVIWWISYSDVIPHWPRQTYGDSICGKHCTRYLTTGLQQTPEEDLLCLGPGHRSTSNSQRTTEVFHDRIWPRKVRGLSVTRSILARSIATRSTLMRSTCHEINSHKINLPRDQLNF